MSTRQLILTFNEDIEPTTINVTGITIQGTENVDTNVSLNYRLTSAQSASVETNTVVRIVLSGEDYDGLQTRPRVATSLFNTYLTMDSMTVTDRSARRNMAQPIVAGNAQQVSTFVPDIIPPTLVSFSLDLNAGTMTLTFDEPVLKASFSSQQLLISSHRDSAAVASYRLTGGNVTNLNTLASSVVEVSLSFSDLISLKYDRNLATGAFNTYLSASVGLVTDTNHNNNTISSGLAVSRFTPDTTSPELLSFGIDLNRELIVLNFNELINASSFDASAITLQSSVVRQVMQSYTLSQSYTSSSDGFQIIVSLSSEDLDAIKSIPTLCTSIADCFITITQSVARDLNGNYAVPTVPGESTLPATYFVSDTTSPELNSWDLDLNEETVTLTFSETVDASTIDVTQLILQSNSIVNNFTEAISLTNSSASDIYSPIIQISLSRNDLNALKRLSNLGTEFHNSYLSFSARFISDTNGNSVLPIPSSAAQLVRTFTLDTVAPVLESFSLNISSGVLSLTFSETVNVSSFDISHLTLVNGRYFDNDGYIQPITFYSLTAGSLQNGFNDPVVIVVLSQRDLNAILAIDDLATSPSDTFLTASSRTVVDMARNPMVPIPFMNRLPVSVYCKYTLLYINQHTRDTCTCFCN